MTAQNQPHARPRFVCFGEVLIRLSPPGHHQLSTASSLELVVGGAEANVASALARLGHDARMLTGLPHGPLGDRALAALRGAGVDTGLVHRRAGRMGLYFMTPGASLRPSDIVYDRADSAFAATPASAYDWTALLAGADWLHLSGITPALGPEPAAACLAAVRAARAAGVRVSFDGNYRARLWDAWDSDPRTILRELVSHADILFGNHRDIALLLDRPFSGEGPERRREAAEAAFAAFPNLTWIASTARHTESVDCHRIAARLDTPSAAWQLNEVRVPGIIDRIGAGDAFAAGVLHGLAGGEGEENAVRAGLALTCLKHSLPGDAALFTQDDINAFEAGGLDVRR